MSKKIFPIYLEQDLYARFKKMYDVKFSRHSFYSMFVDLAIPELEKFEKEEVNK